MMHDIESATVHSDHILFIIIKIHHERKKQLTAPYLAYVSSTNSLKDTNC